MSAEINVHKVGTLEIATKQSGDNQWVQVRVYDWRGQQQLDMTLFAYEGKSVTLKLGEDE